LGLRFLTGFKIPQMGFGKPIHGNGPNLALEDLFLVNPIQTQFLFKNAFIARY